MTSSEALAALRVAARFLRRPVTGPEQRDCGCPSCVRMRCLIVGFALEMDEAEERERFAGGAGAGAAALPPRGVCPAPPALARPA